MKYTKTIYIFLVNILFITDIPRYRAFSPIFIYSVCLYVVVNITSFLSAKDNVLKMFKADRNIGDSIYNTILTVLLVNFTGVPLLTWIDTPKFVQYLHKWKKFQVSNNSSSYNSVSPESNYIWLVLFQHYEARNSQKRVISISPQFHNCLQKSQNGLS
jgi:hypothetical protein